MHSKAHNFSNWTLSIWSLFLQTHNKSESMRLWLHVNYRQFFQGRRGWGGGSVSMYSTHMNGRNLAKELYPDIILLFPRETGDEGWSRVTATPKNAHHLYCELKNRFHHRLNNVILFLCGIMSLFPQQKELSCLFIPLSRPEDLFFLK